MNKKDNGAHDKINAAAASTATLHYNDNHLKSSSKHRITKVSAAQPSHH